MALVGFGCLSNFNATPASRQRQPQLEPRYVNLSYLKREILTIFVTFHRFTSFYFNSLRAQYVTWAWRWRDADENVRLLLPNVVVIIRKRPAVAAALTKQFGANVIAKVTANIVAKGIGNANEALPEHIWGEVVTNTSYHGSTGHREQDTEHAKA